MSNKNELSVIVNATSIVLPSGMGLEGRTNKVGKELGSRLSFIGEKSAATLRAEGRASNLKGKKLDAYVDKSLRGDVVAAAWVRHAAIMSGLQSAGAIPTHLDCNKAGTQFKAEFRLVPVDEVAKAAADRQSAAIATAERLVKAGKFATIEEALAFLA